MFKFKEVTDLSLKVDYSKGDCATDFEPGTCCREVFIIYEGPKFIENKDEFLKQLSEYIGECKTSREVVQ